MYSKLLMSYFPAAQMTPELDKTWVTLRHISGQNLKPKGGGLRPQCARQGRGNDGTPKEKRRKQEAKNPLQRWLLSLDLCTNNYWHSDLPMLG
jgi:hypothetical protein